MIFSQVTKLAIAFVTLTLFPLPQALMSARAQDLSTKHKAPTGAVADAVCPDVPPSHWAWSSVKRIYESGIVEGLISRGYEGDRPITRGEFVVTMARFSTKILTNLNVPYLTKRDMSRSGALAFEPNASGGKEYSDVPRTHWVFPALQRMSACGIIKGLPAGTLGVNAPLNRYDYAVSLERMVAFINNDAYYFEQLENPRATEPHWENTQPVIFKDLPSSHRAYRAVIRLWSVGVFQGDEDTRFQGSKPLTRYEFAVSLSRLLNLQGPFVD